MGSKKAERLELCEYNLNGIRKYLSREGEKCPRFAAEFCKVIVGTADGVVWLVLIDFRANEITRVEGGRYFVQTRIPGPLKPSQIPCYFAERCVIHSWGGRGETGV